MMDIPKEEQKIQYDTLQVAHAQIEYSKFGYKCDQTHARAVFFCSSEVLELHDFQ